MNDHDFIKRVTDATVSAIEEKILEVELALAIDTRPRSPESVLILAELYSRRSNLLGGAETVWFSVLLSPSRITATTARDHELAGCRRYRMTPQSRRLISRRRTF
jgi:hypothetical protein